MTLHRLDELLSAAGARVRSKDKLTAKLQSAKNVVDGEQFRCSKLKDRLAAEQADVDKLEGLSLTGLFYAVLGSKEERLEKERQELLAATLKYEQSVELLESARSDVAEIQTELSRYSDADEEYDRLLKEKETLLSKSGDHRAVKLVEFAETLSDLQSDLKELDEAIDAGQSALKQLQNVSSELGAAANWGTFDLMGGGILSTMAKHSKIDSAKRMAYSAQLHLLRFEEELADADTRLQVSLEIGGFSRFADFFLDGLIADWVVQSKIQNASSACSGAISQVSSAVNRCRSRKAEAKAEFDRLSAERAEFIENA